MGMFDHISVSDALPFSDEMKKLGLDKNTYKFQTKSLDRDLTQYYLQGNKLFEERYKINEFVQGDSEAKTILGQLGYMKREEPYLEQCIINQDVYFYEHIQDVQGKWDCWIEFKAVIQDGVVARYELFKFSKESNAERLESDRKWVDEIDANAQLWHNKYIFYTKVWHRFRHLWIKFFSKLSNVSHRIAFWLP